MNFLRRIIDNARHSLRIGRAKEMFVGSDQYGNKYYERVADESKGIKRKRSVKAVDPDETIVPTVPVEWMTWLQNRRRDPPTPEEIERNYLDMVKTKHRVEKLEKEERIKSSETKTLPSELPNVQKSSFPKYEELEHGAGEFRDEKKSR